MKTRISLFLLLCGCALLHAQAPSADTFDWRRANVYFVITDRFHNGDPTNDQQYGRQNDYGSERLNAATFHGGDIAGLLQKAQEGYFQALGVDVLWMTDVYEQIHGWMSGSGDINDFPHYGYHGYYPLDYTQMDKNYGTIAELHALIDCLHAQGIRVMLGANLNDPGYPTLLDAQQFGFAEGRATADHDPQWRYSAWAKDMADWNEWWTRDWLRMSDEGWDESDPLTCTLFGLPDFKTEKTEPVKIPAFLKKKWKAEKHKNDAWVNPCSVPLRKDHAWAPADYVVAWIAAWVEEFGIDGFRCDIVDYVHTYRWKQLSDACNAALARWRAAHPDDPAAQWTDPIYLTGDKDFADIRYLPRYAEAGFGSMVNFYFPKHGDMDQITYVWQAYADSLHAHADWGPFSYLNNSYHRELDTLRRYECATSLLLAPGTIQLFYGDETARGLSDARYNVDSDQAFRSDMNWHRIDSALLAHYQRLGRIRQAHPAIGGGRQTTLDPHTCARVLDGDTVVISVAAISDRAIPVAPFFREGDTLTECYSGKQATVKNGVVHLPEYMHGVAVLVKL